MNELPKPKTHGLAIASLVLGCFFLIPLLGFVLGLVAIILGIIALVAISNNKQTYKGNGLAISGIVLGALSIIVIPIIALLAAIAIPNFLRARINANEVQAQATVQTIAAASVSYNAAAGRYPRTDSELAYANPPYLSQTYDGKTVNGYTYSVSFTPEGYAITASPETCYSTGMKVFTMKDDQLSESECKNLGNLYEGGK